MKIKAVCEMTNLSDRTIRYYIEQNLISPAYTENYLGRKTFDFKKEDVDALNDIAVLRKFNFTVQEIWDILTCPEQSRKILCDVQSRAMQSVEEGTALLAALSVLDTEKIYTASELARILVTSIENQSLPNECASPNINTVIREMVKSFLCFLAAWLPIMSSITATILTLTKYAYPKFDFKVIVWMLMALLPSGLLFLLPKMKIDRKSVYKRMLIVLCVISIPINLFVPVGLVTKSETTDIRNYRRFDTDCLANRSPDFQEFFPLQAHYFDNVAQADGTWKTVDLDAEYYYSYWTPMDYTYDIYAEWPLAKQAFYQETERVRSLFERLRAEKPYYRYTEKETEQYVCWILYTDEVPFQKVTNSYTYMIFAFDETQNRVRYIYCDSLENGADQPYYLQLEW